MSSNSQNQDPQNQLPQQGYSNTLPEIDAVNPYAAAEQSRILPRQVASGNTRGEQQVRGNWQVTDDEGNIRIYMGYGEGKF